jgi:short-subunit dehydrogenase
MELRDKHVVITGGSKGIGAALAKELKKHGARLTLIARPSAELQQTAAETGAAAIEADLSDLAVVASLIPRAVAANGPIDVLVNNAGIGHTRHYATLSAEDVRSTITTNLLAPMELSRQALVGMLRRNSGAILNVSSVTGEFAVPGCTVYASTKAGLTMFSNTVQRDIRDTKVNVSVVVLGAVAGTQIYNEGTKSEVVKKLAEQLNSVSGITPEQVAQKLVKSLLDDRRGPFGVPWSSGIPLWIRMLPVKLGDLIFSRGKPPHDPVLADMLRMETTADGR